MMPRKSDVPMCATCRFWEFGHQPPHELAEGECRRHAPRPPLHQIYQIGKLLEKIAWASEVFANVEHADESEYSEFESTEPFRLYEWPITHSGQWCGEYEQGQSQQIVTKQRPAVWARLEAAGQWETDVGLDGSGPCVGEKYAPGVLDE